MHSSRTRTRRVAPHNPPPQGMSVRAENIPFDAERMWGALAKAHGAVINFYHSTMCISFFPSQQAARNFIRLVNEELQAPRITEPRSETREAYDKRMARLQRYLDATDPE